MADEKKLTDDELESATGAGPSISAEKTANRGTYGTGQAKQPESRGETEPNPLPDSALGQVQGGAGFSIEAQKTVVRGPAKSGPGRTDPGNVGNTDPV